jgi:outer membrane protein assembly factor BamB
MPFRARSAILCLGLVLLGPFLLVPEGSDGGAERLPPVDPSDDPGLPAEPHLRWVRELPAPRPAWPDQPRMPFDIAPKPAILGRHVFVPSTVTDGVTAYDAETGTEEWTFTTDGPVRLAPTVWEDRLFVASDDGYLYCLEVEHGRLLWKFRGGPSERKVLGNDRLISTWPARGGPVVADGTVYFASGVWPFMGIFIHALDARSGEVVWSNDGEGSTYRKQPHQADSFAGVAPQGTLAVAGDRLLVPGGRSVPACLDRKTGKLLHYRLADNSKIGGGAEVLPGKDIFLNGGVAFDLDTGDDLDAVGALAVVAGDVLYAVQGTELRSFDLTRARIPKETTDRKGKKGKRIFWEPRKVTTVPVPRLEVLIRGGARLYGAAEGQVLAYDLPLRQAGARPSWQAKVDGRPAHLVAGGGHLFVSTREGRLYCFGADDSEPKTYRPARTRPPEHDEWTDRAESILSTTGVRNGWCVAWGVGSGRLIHEIVRQSRLRVIAVEPDEDKAADFRKAMAEVGLYGERVAVLHDSPETVDLPPYLASLMIAEDLEAANLDWQGGFIKKAFASLRPYGGVACFPSSPLTPDPSPPGGEGKKGGYRTALSEAVSRETTLAQAKVREAGPWLLLSRDGPLPGSADWTHENADAANSRVSRDRIVKAPLGLLWFGGSSNEGILPRHGHGPQPQVIDGRLFIEGVDLMRALDIYTGRQLWEAKLPGVGRAYDNLLHQPGANAGGSNYVSLHDGIYVAYNSSVVRLNPATGERVAEFRLPVPPKAKEPPTCGFLTATDNYLIAGTNTLKPDARTKVGAVSSSENLVVLDRQTGKVLWSVAARNGFRHNALCLGGGRLYVIDRPSADHLARLLRRGDATPAKPRLVALDLRNGQEVWSSSTDVFGTWLSYSARHDILVESGRVTRDSLPDEPKGMRAWQGRDGKPMWYRKDYLGPALIRGDTVLKDKSACDLRTGAPLLTDDPLTGEKMEWTWTRTYGCNTPAASENLMTFRSGAAGYYDLCRDGGTGNLGGFRAGCTNNLVVADGLLTAADYTRTCTCSYQNQASLAFVPVPDGEMWTYFGAREVKKPVRRVGIALGAPGNRKADDGTLWLEYPTAGGPSPRVPVSVTPSAPDWFRRHESQVNGQGHPWVAASGGRGLRSVTVTLAPDNTPRTYTVRLTFVEPDRLPPGQRVFDVGLQGQTVLREFDIAKQAGGGSWRGVVKEFKGVRVVKDLVVTLTATGGKYGPVLCGIEAVEQ